MNRNSLVKKSVIPVIIITDAEQEDMVIRVLQTAWKDKFSIICEDAYEVKKCNHDFMTKEQILEKYGIDINWYFNM